MGSKGKGKGEGKGERGDGEGRGMKVGERAFSGGASFSFVSPRPKASGPPTFLKSQTLLRL